MDAALRPACADPRDAMLLMLAERVQALESSLAACESQAAAARVQANAATRLADHVRLTAHVTGAWATGMCVVTSCHRGLRVDVDAVTRMLAGLREGAPHELKYYACECGDGLMCTVDWTVPGVVSPYGAAERLAPLCTIDDGDGVKSAQFHIFTTPPRQELDDARFQPLTLQQAKARFDPLVVPPSDAV